MNTVTFSRSVGVSGLMYQSVTITPPAESTCAIGSADTVSRAARHRKPLTPMALVRSASSVMSSRSSPPQAATNMASPIASRRPILLVPIIIQARFSGCWGATRGLAWRHVAASAAGATLSNS